MVRKKATERPDPVPFIKGGLMMPEKLSTEIFAWRQQLKTNLIERDRFCRSCKIVLAGRRIHMHEGIFSRNTVVCWPKNWRILIYGSLNCVLLCADCNMGYYGKHPPSPADIWQEHCEMYGTETMLEWYDSLPLKQEPHFVTQTRKDTDQPILIT